MIIDALCYTEEVFDDLRNAFVQAMLRAEDAYEATVILLYWEKICEVGVMDTEILRVYGIEWH